jgi:DNA polymerase I
MSITPITLDFETLPIQNRPNYPPKPVSFSLKLPNWKEPKFYAWGHKTGGNNCSFEDAKRVLEEAYASVSDATPLLCHNAKFDLDVAEEHFGLRLPDWRKFHDTMFLLFLDDPHQRSLGLKESAERILGLPPEERDAVKDWILTHKRQLESDFPEIVEVYDGIKPSTAGAFIAYVPGDIVGAYADGDVTRTEALFTAKYEDVCVTRGMKVAYERERRLLPILLRNEREGIHVDVQALERDQAIFEAAKDKADQWIKEALGTPLLDLDKDAQVSNALFEADALTEWSYTTTGRRSVSKKSMKLSHFKDQQLAAMYSYRQKCATMLETFIRPWQKYAVNGVMHTNWNQVRQAKGANGTGGTRTGRPSTDRPNFLNVPRNLKGDNIMGGFMMPTGVEGLPLPPIIRQYVLPDSPDHVVVKRDFDGQELRILGHFEDGALMQAYADDPNLDVHQFVRDQIEALVGISVTRSFAKTLNFGFVYGQGAGSLAEALEREVDEVKSIRNAQMKALPGLKDLNDEIKRRFKRGEFITTWGGRQYYCEPPAVINDRHCTFEYKGLNYLIQGSAADITKEAMIRYDEARKDGRMMLTVYDEIDISVPKGAAKSEAKILRDCMFSIELDVPLTSGCEVGATFGDVEEIEEEPFDFSRWRS